MEEKSSTPSTLPTEDSLGILEKEKCIFPQIGHSSLSSSKQERTGSSGTRGRGKGKGRGREPLAGSRKKKINSRERENAKPDRGSKKTESQTKKPATLEQQMKEEQEKNKYKNEYVYPNASLGIGYFIKDEPPEIKDLLLKYENFSNRKIIH